jgi:hypothetical protein
MKIFNGSDWKPSPKQLIGQLIAYALFVALIGSLAGTPAYRHLPEGMATIKLSLRHSGQPVGECRERTPKELANLPENMRAPLICPRERSSLHIELTVDDELALSEILPARGLHSDGRASMYHRLSVPAGITRITVKLKDQMDSDRFQYSLSREVLLEAGKNLVIDFNEQSQSFELLQGSSDQRAALQNSLNDFETGDRQHQDDNEEDDASIRQRLTTALLD